MGRVLIVTPPAPLVTVAEAKDHLRVDSDEQDTLITGLIAAVSAHIDGPDGWLGRAIGAQELEAGLDSFCYDPIALPCPPVVEVVSVRYEDAAGVWQTLDAARYEVRDGQVGSAWGAAWPATRAYRGASRSVLIRYRAGYAAVPAPIKVAVLMMVADLYRNPGEAGDGSTGSKVAMATPVAALLGPYRVFV